MQLGKDLPHQNERKTIGNEKVSVRYFMKNAEEIASKLHFTTCGFETSEASSKKLVSTIKKAIKGNWAPGQTGEACEKQKLTEAETAFALNFAHVYWPAFEIEADLREPPEEVVGYLVREAPSKLGEKGYCSFFISLLSETGAPAGFVTGAIGNVNRLFERFGIPKMEKNITFTFIGYVALPRSSQLTGADKVLFSEVEKLVESTGRTTDHLIMQVDKPSEMEKELSGLKEKLARTKSQRQQEKLGEEIEVAEERVRRASILMELWPSRHGLKRVEGLESMEIIHEYGDDKTAPLPAPEKQPPLELLIRPANGEGTMPLAELEALVKGLYLYYEIFPGIKIEGTNAPALEAYLKYSLEKVSAKDGQVGLSDINKA